MDMCREASKEEPSQPLKALCSFRCKTYCRFIDGKYTLAAPEMLLFFSPLRALLTGGEAILTLCPVCYHLCRPHWFPTCSRKDPQPAGATITPHISFHIQLSGNIESLNGCDSQQHKAFPLTEAHFHQH